MKCAQFRIAIYRIAVLVKIKIDGGSRPTTTSSNSKGVFDVRLECHRSLCSQGDYNCIFYPLCALNTWDVWRLYQRKNEAQVSLLSKQMLSLMVAEDSAHYVMYTFFLLNQRPVFLYLFPVCLYAILHIVTFTQGMAQFLPPSIQRVLTSANMKIGESQQGIKRAIACAEVLIMVVVILNAFSGAMFIFAPLVHYQFLKLRYMSKRNPYVKVIFSDLRLGAEGLARHPSCPAIISAVISKAISIISSLAPTEMVRREP
ncbi:hypothetical protein EMCRGX_G025157 [Ephydatia muelleri]